MKNKKSLDKCSFCGKKDDNEPFLENDNKTACICQNCAGMLAAYVSDKEQDYPLDMDEDFTKSSIPDWDAVDKSSLQYKLSLLIDSINEDTWFPSGSPSVFSFPDGVKIVAEEEEIEDPDSFLEIYDEMNLYQSKELNGVAFNDDEAILEILEREGNMWLFTFTFDFLEAKDPEDNVICQEHDGRDVRVRYLQFGAGEICGYNVIISPGHDMDSISRWVEHINHENIKVTETKE